MLRLFLESIPSRSNPMDIEHEVSFGVIPLRKRGNGWEVLLIQHLAGHWSFPKGKPDHDLSLLSTAERELLEETGLTVLRLLREDPFVETYSFERNGKFVSKVVSYFPAIVQGDVLLRKEELSLFVWLPLAKAKHKVTFKEAKELSRKFELWLTNQNEMI